jgi:hypothetical protein
MSDQCPVQLLFYYHDHHCCYSPTVHNNGPCMRQTFLPLVDLVQEAQDTPGLAGDPVVRPAQVLVMPDLPNQIRLGQGYRVSALCSLATSHSASSHLSR